MTRGAVLFVDIRTGKKISFVRGHGRRGNVLLVDMRVQSHIRQLLLKRHGRIGGCYRRHACGKIIENTTHCNCNSQNETDHDTLYHLCAPVVTRDQIRN